MPGQPVDGGVNPAAFPRPAGPGGEAQVGGWVQQMMSCGLQLLLTTCTACQQCCNTSDDMLTIDCLHASTLL